jgi:hypothetical protein
VKSEFGSAETQQGSNHAPPAKPSGARAPRFRKPSIIPGFGLTLGFTLFYLTAIILIPLSALVWRTTGLGWAGF